MSRDVMIGLEIHQQLDTPKLFCRCPSRLDETDEPAKGTVVFERVLRPTQSELGEVDRAAVHEAEKRLRFRYVGDRGSSCLVEMDEEPPHALSPEALHAALEVALLLDAEPVDEVHVMRKIVIDGSNTSGFQRTSMLALGGRVKTSKGDVGLQTLCLEEDAARKVEATSEEGKERLVTYRLDRLGIPLVEIATAPDIVDGEHAREAALALGTALRATGKVKRGIGTIRQDLNISVGGGSRVEVKGVQDLWLIPKVTQWEVERHRLLMRIRDELGRRGASPLDGRVLDASDVFRASESKPVRFALDSGGAVLAVVLPGFAGLLKGDSKEGPRLGRDLAEHAKVRAAVKGIFHSDELPAYGVNEKEVAFLKAFLREHAAFEPARDAYVLSAAPRKVAEAALAAVVARATQCFDGVPEETRDALPDGTTAYLRPLPGRARMYPETDVPPFRVTGATLARIRAALPELPEARLARWKREHPEVGEEMLGQLVRSDPALFERIAKTSGNARDAARVLVAVVPELDKLGVPTDADRLAAAVPGALAAQAGGAFAKEAFPQVLAEMLRHTVDATEATRRLGLAVVDVAAVEEAVDRLLASRAEYVRARGAAAASGLMGPLMAE
ncbi:MAG TPA: Glu-tRNA(Gln) amidotransferase subunit GatE, partial [Candidatus Thermoplasmatota archaeon]|nr:Glu-tRNA(Gln) amidotransferase subunit GatE [Candidatus Thermoplasmatota archaeon]